MGLFDSLSNTVSEAATSASAKINTTLENASAVVSSTVNSAATKAADIAKSAQSGVTNLANTLTGNIPGQVAQAVGAAANQASNFVNLGMITESVSSSIAKLNISTSPPFPNILHNYASYNYIFTLSVIDKNNFNFPETGYRIGNIGEIVCKSGSGNPTNRIQTEYGKFEFFIDDVVIRSTITPNETTATSFSSSISFTITETYSLGLFYQAVETAALKTGHLNWQDAPFLLTIQFIGHINGDMQGVPADAMSIDKTTKYFPIKFAKCDMTVNNKGSIYKVETVPYTEIAFSTVYNNLKTDISIAGASIHEMLQTGEKSLQKVMNDRLKNLAKRDGRDPDQILIYFPIDAATPVTSKSDTPDAATSSATSPGGSVNSRLKISPGKNETLVQAPADMNPIGKCSMEFDYLRPADQSVSKDNQVWDEQKKIYVRAEITVNPNSGEMRFSQDTSIVDIINQVILTSGYGRQALQPAQMKNGQIPWWKIEPQVYLLSDEKNITKTGVPSKLIVYRVIQYGMDASKLLSPNADNPMITAIRNNVVKEYNYIYTAKNTDVIDFQIHFDSGFYKADVADLGQNSDSTDVSNKKSNTPADVTETTAPGDDGKAPAAGIDPVAKQNDKTSTSTGNRGGTSYDTPSNIAARRAHDMLLNSVDMTNIDLKIVGDPYWIGDSGVGNYVSQQTNYDNINADHSINTQSGDNTFSVNFRTPIDLDMATGAYNFGPTKLVGRFSGVYKVNEVETSFSRGKFVQSLKGYRIHGQTAFDGTVAASSGLPSLIAPAKQKPAASEDISADINSAGLGGF